MAPLSEMGKWMIIAGVAVAAVGAFLLVAGRIPWVGRLPGDIVWEKGRFKVWAPFGTMILVSVGLTLLLNLFFRFFR
jgi:hypothetical protein